MVNCYPKAIFGFETVSFLFIEDYTADSCFGDNADADPFDVADLDIIDLRGCLTEHGGMDDDGPIIPSHFAEPVDHYFSKVHGAGGLQVIREAY